jgi:type I restriction enzyme M protein
VPTNYNLSRINMFLHNINFDKFDIQCGNTLTDPRHRQEEPFDAIVSNPPYSQPWDGDSNPILINDDRYSPAGILAPKSASDLAFTMHILKSLSESGTAAIVEFPGVLYRGGAEKKIRQYLVNNNFVDTVIQLPQNLFFGVSIATCIIVLRKSARPDNNILFVDASSQFVKNGNKNLLTPENQDAIVRAYAERKEVQYFTRLVSCQDVAANDFNLSVSSYVEQEDTREAIDILQVNADLETLCTEGNRLRNEINQLIKTL